MANRYASGSAFPLNLLIRGLPIIVVLLATVSFSISNHLKSVQFADSLRQLRALERTSSALYFAGVEFKDGAISLLLNKEEDQLVLERYQHSFENLRSQMIVASARTEQLGAEHYLRKLETLMDEIDGLHNRVLQARSNRDDLIAHLRILDFVIQRWLVQVEALNAAIHLKTIQVDALLDSLQKTSLLVFASVLFICLITLTVVSSRWYKWRTQQLDREAFLARMAEIDPLTGLMNRRGWDRVCRGFDEDPKTLADGLSLVMLDLDHFKKYNDAQGHAAGDYLLSQFSQALQKNSRPNDAVARLGGEEFALALPQCNSKAAEQLIQRIRKTAKMPIGFSAGIAEVAIGERIADALARADRALYRAKHLGRARTCLDNTNGLETININIEPSNSNVTNLR